MERWLDRVLFIAALAILLFGAAGGAWNTGSDHALLAAELERSALAPLYSALAGVAAHLPFAEPWFRIGALNAVLGAMVLVGVARAARALLPKDPVAGHAAAVALVLTPPFREAAALPGPSILAACGAVWLCAFTLEHARDPSRARAWRMLAAIAVVVGSAPWLGLALGAFAIGRRYRELAIGIGAIGALVVIWWFGAVGRIPEVDPDLSATIAATGRGAAAVVVGAGMLGIAFATVTALPHARWLAGAIAIAALHAVLVDHAPVAILATMAIGLAVIPGGIVRAVGAERRHAIAALAGAPLVGAALLSGAAFSVDDPGHAPARVAFDLTTYVPAGPGALAVTRPQTRSALAYAQHVAGLRPDLQVQPVDRTAPGVDVVLANQVRAGAIVAADIPAIGRIDLLHTYPRGRAYLLGNRPTSLERVLPPPRYASALGDELATTIAIDRGRYEAANGRLANAARATGLTERFDAGDLAILSTTMLVRPPFFGFIPPLDELPPGRWLLDLFGDDLAWVAGLDTPMVDAPRERKLHGLWRQLWNGTLTADDPQITTLGPAAIEATAEVDELRKKNRR